HLKTTQKFLRNGGHVDARNKDTMWTLLHTACHAGQNRVVEVLVSAGAKLESESTTDQLFTPLLIAVFNGKLGLSKCLVAAGANVEARNKQSYTSLTIAAQQGHADI
ncbi:unnamed protein product, partial [Ectocarpus sp. 8 AP-2014]